MWWPVTVSMGWAILLSARSCCSFWGWRSRIFPQLQPVLLVCCQLHRTSHFQWFHCSLHSPYLLSLLLLIYRRNSQYVGETKNALKTRFFVHRSHIRKNTGTLVSRHFNQQDNPCPALSVWSQKRYSIATLVPASSGRVFGSGSCEPLTQRVSTRWVRSFLNGVCFFSVFNCMP